MTRRNLFISNSLAFPKWVVIRSAIETQESLIEKEQRKPVEFQDHKTIRDRLATIAKHKQELKRYNHIFN